MATTQRTLFSHVVYRVGFKYWHVANENLDMARPARARDVWLVTPAKAAGLRAALIRRLAEGGAIYDLEGRMLPGDGFVEEGRHVSNLGEPVTTGACPVCHAQAEIGFAGRCISDCFPIMLARCTECTYIERLVS